VLGLYVKMSHWLDWAVWYVQWTDMFIEYVLYETIRICLPLFAIDIRHCKLWIKDYKDTIYFCKHIWQPILIKDFTFLTICSLRFLWNKILALRFFRKLKNQSNLVCILQFICSTFQAYILEYCNGYDLSVWSTLHTEIDFKVYAEHRLMIYLYTQRSWSL